VAGSCVHNNECSEFHRMVLEQPSVWRLVAVGWSWTLQQMVGSETDVSKDTENTLREP
jgi:hypothetical protein